MSFFSPSRFCGTVLVFSLGLMSFSLFICLPSSAQTPSTKPLPLLSLADPIQPLSLETYADDSLATAKIKAAYRLFAGYSQVEGICRKCSLSAVMTSYAKANGRSLAQAVELLKNASALTPEWKSVLEQANLEGINNALASASCEDLSRQISQGDWALHKGRFTDDYNLIRGQ
jgi:hypothetical protein